MELHSYFQYSRGGGVHVLLQRKVYFSKDPEGVQHFPGGGGDGQLLPGVGSKYLFL